MTLYNHMYTYTTGYCKGSGKRELCNRRGSVSTDSVARQARIQWGGVTTAVFSLCIFNDC